MTIDYLTDTIKFSDYFELGVLRTALCYAAAHVVSDELREAFRRQYEELGGENWNVPAQAGMSK